MSSRIRVALIGLGYWGPNLARNFSVLDDVELAAICDLDQRRLATIGRQFGQAERTTDVGAVISDPRIDAVAIATPVSTHFDIALAALRAGKHVFVEKPLAASTKSIDKLIAEAEKRRLVLMVDHIFVYTPAVRRIRELIDAGEMGQLLYYDSVRINLGLFQSDVNVLWDLAVHDLSIMDYLLDAQQPEAVSATGIAHYGGHPENIAYLTCFLPGQVIAHFHVNWLAPVKIRRTLIGGARRMIVYDELEPDQKVKIYDRGVAMDRVPARSHDLLVGYRTGDMWAPRLDTTEALRTATQQFVDCISSKKAPITDGMAGRRVVRILEAAERSLKAGGRPIKLTA